MAAADRDAGTAAGGPPAPAPAAPPPDDVSHDRFWRASRALCRLVTTTFFEFRAYGVENVPRTGGVLLVSNHQSFLDPVLLGVWLPRTISFLAKAELFEHRIFGALIRRLSAFPVRRGEGDVGAVKEAIRRLHEGRILIMFPEGTRTSDGRVQAIQPGIGMLVRRAGVPVVPAVIDGSFEAWPRRAKLFRPHPVRVSYGRPLATEGLKGKEIVDLLGTTLRTMLAELRERGRERRL